MNTEAVIECEEKLSMLDDTFGYCGFDIQDLEDIVFSDDDDDDVHLLFRPPVDVAMDYLLVHAGRLNGTQLSRMVIDSVSRRQLKTLRTNMLQSLLKPTNKKNTISKKREITHIEVVLDAYTLHKMNRF